MALMTCLEELDKVMQRNAEQANTIAGTVSAIRIELNNELAEVQSSGPGDPWKCTRAALTEKLMRFMPVLDMLADYAKQSAESMHQLYVHCDKVQTYGESMVSAVEKNNTQN